MRPGEESFPIVRMQDGTVVVAPTIRQIAKAAGLAIAPRHADYDVAVVGGGPAGMAAAVYGASEGLRTILIERKAPGGQAGQSSRIENYLGFPVGVSGDELASRALNQAKRFGAEIVVTRSVEALRTDPLEVALDGGETLRARTIILALGVIWRRLNLAASERLTGEAFTTARRAARRVQPRARISILWARVTRADKLLSSLRTTQSP